MKTVIVASENPVKLDVARRAFSSVLPDTMFDFFAMRSESGVTDQPMNEETEQGALNRLRSIRSSVPNADYWISQEAGCLLTGQTCQFFAIDLEYGNEETRVAVDTSYRCDFGNQRTSVPVIETTGPTRLSSGGSSGTRTLRTILPTPTVLGVHKHSNTDANVKLFQERYRSEILDPWYERAIVPHNRPTGFVYKTTRWKINDTICPGYEAYPSFDGEDLRTNINIDGQ